MWDVGLNPYGLMYTLGLQSLDTGHANPNGEGLAGFAACARDIEARCIEVDWRWLTALANADVTAFGDACRARGMRVLVSAWLRHQPGETLEDAIRVSAAAGAVLLRLHLTPVLEGARARLGAKWFTLVAHARATLIAEAPRAAAAGIALAIENHQDFCSEELLDLADAAGEHVGLVLDTGNPFAVGEDPVACARRMAPRLRHVHLKDYRAQFTAEGVRLVRCAIGEGCVPIDDIAAALDGLSLTASLEPGALQARHIPFFDVAWWNGYPARSASEFATAIGRLRHRAWPPDADVRTPWEAHAPPAEIVAYERRQLRRSVRCMRSRGWL